MALQAFASEQAGASSAPLQLELLRVELRQLRFIDQLSQTFGLRLWVQARAHLSRAHKL